MPHLPGFKASRKALRNARCAYPPRGRNMVREKVLFGDGATVQQAAAFDAQRKVGHLVIES